MAEKRLTREQARELYDDLHRAMSQMMTKNGQPLKNSQFSEGGGSGSPEATSKAAKEIAAAIRSGLNGKGAANVASSGAYAAQSGVSPSTQSRGSATRSGRSSTFTSSFRQGIRRPSRGTGSVGALALMAALCALKITLSAIEAAGIVNVEPAVAAAPIVRHEGPDWSKEEVKVLTALDHRRAELEERSARLEQKEGELASRDRDVAVKLSELKELTDRLKIEREKGERQRNGQLDQLANVYGSMNPPEAAHLLEQLDIQVSLSLIQRMPEKRMAQILALMSPQRALELTNLLSQRTSN